MKTFGELKEGDKVYSLNYKDWGVLTEHTVTDVKRDDKRTVVIVKGYFGSGDNAADLADLKLVRGNKNKIGEIAPSIEGTKQYWISEIDTRINRIKKEIENLNDHLQREYEDLNKIINIGKQN